MRIIMGVIGEGVMCLLQVTTYLLHILNILQIDFAVFVQLITFLMSKALFINSLIATGTECFQEIIFSSMETYRFILALDLTGVFSILLLSLI